MAVNGPPSVSLTELRFICKNDILKSIKIIRCLTSIVGNFLCTCSQASRLKLDAKLLLAVDDYRLMCCSQ